MVRAPGRSVPPHLMRLRRAVLQIPARRLPPPRLPFYKIRSLLTCSESTLPQMLIPLHFNCPIVNTYEKPGRGSFLRAPKFCNSPMRAPRGRSEPGSNLSVCSARSALCKSTHQYHSMGLTRPLFSYSYALFCTAQSVNSFPLNHFRTLSTKHRGGCRFPYSSVPKVLNRRLSTRNFLLLPSPPYSGATCA